MAGASELSAAAAAAGLPRYADRLRRLAEPELLDGFDARPVDARLDAPPAKDLLDLLGQMVRRGGDPRLLPALWAAFDGSAAATPMARPLEAGLAAWDVLNRALLSDADAEQLRKLARPLRAALPDVGRACVDLNQHAGAELIKRFAGLGELARATEVELMAYALDQRLAALGELERRGDGLPRRPASKESLRSFARLLDLAHLPTLAGVAFDFLVRGLGERRLGIELCEVYFDAGAPERLPGDAIQQGDLPPAELHDVAEYLVYRTWQSLGDANKAYTLLEANLAKRPRELAAPGARLVVTRAHLATLFAARPVSLERVDRLYDEQRTWRYGARARAVVCAGQSAHGSVEPAQVLYDFLTGFGHDAGCFVEALAAARPIAGWKREVAHMLAREVMALPHEVAAWRSLAMFLGSREEIAGLVEELDARLRRQAKL